jgi:hypothetical protein
VFGFSGLAYYKLDVVLSIDPGHVALDYSEIYPILPNPGTFLPLTGRWQTRNQLLGKEVKNGPYSTPGHYLSFLEH